MLNCLQTVGETTGLLNLSKENIVGGLSKAPDFNGTNVHPETIMMEIPRKGQGRIMVKSTVA